MSFKSQSSISAEWALCICSIAQCNVTCDQQTIQDIIDSALFNPGNAAGFYYNDGNGNFSWIPLQHSEDYFFIDTASDIATYKQMTTTDVVTQFTITTAGVTDTQVLQNWATNANVPDTATIPEGLYSVNIHAAQTVGTKVTQLYAEIWEVSNVGVDIAKIGTTGFSTALTVSQSDIFVTFDLANAYIMASVTSRIVARVRAHVTGVGSAPTVVLYYGGVTDSHLTVPATASFGGIIPPSQGGTGLDTSASTGVAQVNSGTWSVSTALANGTTATTQSPGDNSDKLATTKYVDQKNRMGATEMGVFYSMSFNGSTQYLFTNGSALQRLLNVLMIKGNQQFTFGMWINATALPSSGNHMNLVTNSAGVTSIFDIRITNNGGTSQIDAVAGTSTNFTTYTATTTSISTSTWYFITVVYDGSQAVASRVKIYINATNQTITTANTGTGAPTPAFTTNTIDWYIAQNGASANFYNGLITEITGWDDLLSANSVTALYNSGTPINPTAASGSYVSNYKLISYVNFILTNSTPLVTDSLNGNGTLSSSGTPTLSTTIP